MVWNPIANFATCVKSRPPLVVFTFCLFSFLLTTVSLAFYIHRTDKIENQDTLEQWISLTSHIDKSRFCVEDEHAISKLNISSVDKLDISTYAMVSLPLTSKTFVHGILSLKDWSFPCVKDTQKPELLEIFFNISPVENSINEQNVCVTIRGPTHFMPKVNSPFKCNLIEEKEPFKRLNISNKKTSCMKSVLRLEFDKSSINKIKTEELLSENDKWLINMHLIATSYFIIFVIVMIICYALIKGNKSEKKQDSRFLLSGKVVHA